MSSLQLKNFVKCGTKIVCAGANYRTAPNFKEKPADPVIFIKPVSSYILEGEKICIPEDFKVNQEVELGVVIGKKCKNVSQSNVMDVIGGYCIAQDLTATNFLEKARGQGLPWCMGKGFDTACPVSTFIPKEKIPDPHQIEIWCKVNGQERQRGNTKDFVFTIPELISYITQYMTLEPYDLILTGSPPNMGPIKPSDFIESGIEGIDESYFGVKVYG
ncbi:acylpyruvase FAHD1, mitochondrial [Agrilus planipennis]|uniref:oxaloacetate tautomerase n=1 Tax=Agrilus planipennis TaxID=224129 RepID=A0A1W4WHX1_AGRPL|nr:acylpyruvase FAHD1, mitochondrial [Agrilus planipennis]